MTAVSILDPSKLNLNILGCKVEGFSKGSFINIAKETPTFSTRTSVKGSKTVIGNKTADYHLTFRLDGTADANTWLHAICKLQEMYGAVFPVPIVYKDLNGHNSFFSATGIIQEPRVDQGSELTPTEWTVICPKAINTIGGNGKNGAVAQVLSTITTLLSVANFANIDLGGIQQQAQSIYDSARNVVGGLF